jgi:hypothetical protein
MRFLKFGLYNQGDVGFFNNLMSLELAVGLSIMSNRHLLLNLPKPIFNSDKGMNLFDLVDLLFPHEKGDFGGLESALKAVLQLQPCGANLLLHCGPMLLIVRSRLLREPRAFATFMNRKKAG